jgi:hypothetical protein
VGVQREHLTFTPESLRLLIPLPRATRRAGGGVWCPTPRGPRPAGARCGGLAAGRRLPLRPGIPQDRPLTWHRDRHAARLRSAQDPGAAARAGPDQGLWSRAAVAAWAAPPRRGRGQGRGAQTVKVIMTWLCRTLTKCTAISGCAGNMRNVAALMRHDARGRRIL